MSKSFYRLRDQGTSFYDIQQGAGVVANRVAPLENTAKVNEAVRAGELIKLEVAEGKASYNKQVKADKAAGIITDATANEDEKSELDEARAGVSGGDVTNVIKTMEDATKEEDLEANPDKAAADKKAGKQK